MHARRARGLELAAFATVAALAIPSVAVAATTQAATPSTSNGLTRAELAMTASRTLAALRGWSPTVESAPFTDMAGHPWQADITRAWADGLVLGHADGTFRPDATASDHHVEVVNARLRGVLEAEGLLLPGPGDIMPVPVIATFQTADGTFRALIDDPASLNRLASAELGTHVGIPNGLLQPGDGGVNTGHDWHLVEVELVDMTMELCDASAAYVDELGHRRFVEEHGDRFCPWAATLVELEPFDS